MGHSPRLFFGIFILLGAVISILFLFPVHDFLNFHESKRSVATEISGYNTSFEYVFDNLKQTLAGKRIAGTFFFGLIGIVLGSLFYFAFIMLNRRDIVIQNLTKEIGRDIGFLIAKGESSHLEFKSSFRWDYKKQEVNKALEHAVLKNIAGFMNAEGGSIIIGVDDNAQILGLDHDYQTLKVKNRDGFEVAIMTAVASHIGANYCALLTIIFHTLDEKDICQILVSRAKKPAFLKNGNTVQFYLRTGAAVRELNVKESSEYILNHW